ncbi:MAG: hypothetical protein BWY31_00054 [Lentisphaerae bacterium ADurb.Bin242]|nr:MAG: hypothetical protein BWY31_00054 [Lentisphaerae bacterium ADurb.Bin242]
MTAENWFRKGYRTLLRTKRLAPLRFLSRPLPGFVLKYGLAAVVLLALLLRLADWYYEPELSRDGVYYLDLAKKWHETGSFTVLLTKDFYIPPLVLFLMKNALDLGMDPVTAVRTVGLAGNLICVLFCYELAMLLKFSREMALAAALLFAVEPMLVKLSCQVQRESLYLFFILLAFWLIAEAESRNRLPGLAWGAAGISWTLAFFCRHEAVEILLWLAAFVLWLAISRKIRWTAVSRRVCFFLVGSCVTWGGLNLWMGIPVSYYRSAVQVRIKQHGFSE